MSTNVVNKLDIDVLVHVAVYGPAGADDWRRLDDQPDESGRALWGQNWERAGYEVKDRPPIEDYTFEPLPFAITVGEAFAHLGYFRYQTAEEFGRGWYGSFAGRYEAAVRTQLEGFVEGVKEAPWGWSPRDVRDRLSRGGAPGSDQTEPDPAQDSQLAAVETAFAEGGITLTRLADPGGRRPEGLAFAPRTVIGAWEVRVGGTPEYPATGFLPALQVWLFADEEAARSTYRANLRRHQDERDSRPYGASRIGNVVILWSAFDSGHEAELLRGGLSVLGEPDEHWRGRPPQELLGPVQVGAVRALTTEGAGSGMRYMVVARTPKELERLAGFIVDDDVRQQALAIDVSRQSALLLVGVASVDPGGLVTLQERVAETPDGAFTSDETVTEMTLDLAGLTMNAASLVTVPALRRAPQTARVWGPHLKTNMPIMDA